MLEEQIRKSANRCQQFVLKINREPNGKIADSNLQVMGVALNYTIRRNPTLTLQAPINIHIQILQSDLHTLPVRIS